MRVLLAVLSLTIAFSVQADVRGGRDYSSIERFPRSSIVQYKESDNVDYRLILGGLEKINGVITPEKEQRLTGSLYQVTYRIPSTHNSAEALAYLSDQLIQQGAEKLFDCQGRACGSSNQWANAIFKYSRLYGVDQSQWFATFKHNNLYYSLYAVQRGNKKVYLRLEVLDGDGKKQSGDDPLNEIAEYDNSRLHFEKLFAYLRDNPSKKVWIVATANEEGSFQQRLDRATHAGDRLRDRLLAEGISGMQVEVHPIGSFLDQYLEIKAKIILYSEDL